MYGGVAVAAAFLNDYFAAVVVGDGDGHRRRRRCCCRDVDHHRYGDIDYVMTSLRSIDGRHCHRGDGDDDCGDGCCSTSCDRMTTVAVDGGCCCWMHVDAAEGLHQ